MRNRKKTVALSRDSIAGVREQINRFRRKFGREIVPGEPLFFDPSKDEPTPIPLNSLKEQTADLMRKAGVAPHLVYAYLKTGLLPTEGNRHSLSSPDMKEFCDACEEYLRLEAQK